MPHDAHHAILGQRAGGPLFLSMRREPLMRRIVLNMRGIDQRDQHIHIGQENHPGNSSRNRFNNSGVTAVAPARTGSKGTPLRALPPGILGRSACRVSSEMTSPTLLCCREAKPLAAARTSSSMDRVVRILYLLKDCIKHHASSIRQYALPTAMTSW